MKILFIGSNPKTYGGIQTFGRNLSSIFKGSIKFLTLYKEKTVFKMNFVIECLDKTIFWRCINKITNGRILNYFYHKKIENEIDVYILNFPKLLKFIDFRKGKKVLIQHRDHKNFISSKNYFSNDKKLIKLAEQEIDLLVTLSPNDKEEFLKKSNFKKVVFIRHMSSIPLLEKPKKKSKDLIMICRLSNQHKRLDLAIKAMKKLPDFTLNIYGSGPDEKKLKELSKTINNVVFHGPTNRVMEKLDENSIFIMTSDYEGYGITNIEAMRRGLPLILRDTFTAASDIVKENGVLLSKEWSEESFIDAVYEVYNNYEIFSENSVKLGKRHDYFVFKNKWEKVMNDIECEGENEYFNNNTI